jgi:hypothetical protein
MTTAPTNTPGSGPQAAADANPWADQTRPVAAGFTRIEGFMDVANYDDALFQDFVKNDRYWQFILTRPGHSNPGHRQAHFNSEFFENSSMAIEWNRFVAARRK